MNSVGSLLYFKNNFLHDKNYLRIQNQDTRKKYSNIVYC